MTSSSVCKRRQDKIKRLRLREKGEYKRCSICGKVGLQAYDVMGEKCYGFPYDRYLKGRTRKLLGIRFCRYCQIEFEEE